MITTGLDNTAEKILIPKRSLASAESGLDNLTCTPGIMSSPGKPEEPQPPKRGPEEPCPPPGNPENPDIPTPGPDEPSKPGTGPEEPGIPDDCPGDPDEPDLR